MSDLSYRVDVDSRRARENLRRLQTSTQQTTQNFDLLKRAIGALALTALVRSTFNAAASIRDLSNATNIAVQNIIGFQQAFVAAGGSANAATTSIERFTTRIGQAVQGSAELQLAFQRVGVSIEDLRTLSEQDILRQTVRGLAEIESSSERAATGFRLLGRDVRAINLRELENRLDGATASAADSAAAFAAAGDTMQNFSNSFQILQQEILIALQPLSEFVNRLLENEERTRRVIRAITELAVALGGLFIVTRLARVFTTFGRTVATVFTGLSTGAKTSTLALSLMRGQVRDLITLFRRVSPARWEALGLVLRSLSRVFILVLPFVAKLAAVLFVVNAAVTALTGAGLIEWLQRAIRATAEWTSGLRETADRVGDIQRQAMNLRNSVEDTSIKVNVETETDAAGSESVTEQIQRDVIDALAQQRLAIQDNVRAYKLRNSTTLRTLELERDLLGLSEEQVAVQRAISNFYSQYESQIDSLSSRLRQLNLEPEKNAALIEEINSALEQVHEEYRQQLPLIIQIVEQTEAQRAALEQAAIAADNVRVAMESTADFSRRMSQSTAELQREFNQLDMSPLERQVDNITNSIRRETQEEVRRLQQLLNEVEDPESAAQIRQQIQQINQISEETILQQRRLAEEAHAHQRSFAFGWRDAFRQYADDATNAANRARSIFETTTRSMEDSIVNFAKTGKFEWRSFVSTIVEELLRQRVRQLIASTFGSFGGGGAGGASGRGGLFSGFFATGGQIPAGRFGVVGESGPELVSGPATVTPDFGGSNVTYNINAVDAQSFQQLVARDPQFLFAVTEQGRKSLPQTRR